MASFGVYRHGKGLGYSSSEKPYWGHFPLEILAWKACAREGPGSSNAQ